MREHRDFGEGNFDSQEFDLTVLGNFDFSSTGLFGAWQLMCTKKQAFKMPNTFTAEENNQLLFKACFGAAFEDHAVLAAITGINEWTTRASFDKRFTDFGRKPNGPDMQLQPLKFGAKLASACMTNLGAGVEAQILPCPTFSGHCKYPLLKRAVKAILEAQEVGGDGLTTIANVRKYLFGYFVKLLQRYVEGKEMKYGTVQWFNVNSIDLTLADYKKHVTHHAEVIDGGNQFFHPLSEADRKMALDPKEDWVEKAMKKLREMAEALPDK